MDIITQAALGGAIAQGGFKSHQRRGVAFGAFCGIVPDLDGLLSIGDRWQGLVTHRGSSHSLLVLPLLAIPLGWLGWRLCGRRGRVGRWIHLAFWALITHPLLDLCTTYGTQLFAPLTNARFALDTVAIIDPFYSLPIFAALIVGFRSSAWPDKASTWARRALIWGLSYLAFQLLWTRANDSVFRERLAAVGFQAETVRTPVPVLWPVIRHAVAHDKEGRIAVSKQILWAPERDPILILEPADSPRIRSILDTPRGRIWSWFADGMVGIRMEDDGTIVLSDHRYGLYSDKTYSFFRAELPPGAPVDELEMVRPSQSRKKLNLGQEWLNGLKLMTAD